MSPQKGGKHGPRRARFDLARLEPLEPRALMAAAAGEEIAFGPVDGRNVVARFAPAPGLRVSVSLTGPGTGAATVRDGGRVDLRLEGTTDQTVVTVKSAGRLALALGALDLRGPLGALRAPAAVLSGGLSLDHPVGELSVGRAHDLTVDAAGVDLGVIRADAWTDDPQTPRDRITADSLAGLTIGTAPRARKGRAPAPVADFAVAFDVPRLGTVAVAGNASLEASFISADAVVVGGNLRSSKISVMPTAVGEEASLGRLAVGGTMDGVKVVALGDVGAVSAAAMVNTDVLAGVRYGKVGDSFEHVLPTEHVVTGETVPKDYDFVGAYRIGSVAVTGLGGDGNARPARRRERPDSSPFRKPARRPRFVAGPVANPTPTFAFSNSRVAAYQIGDVALEGVGGFDATRDWGVAAYSVGRVLRRFAQPGTGTERFFVRQTSEPLVVQEGAGGVGGYFGNGPVGGMSFVKIVDIGGGAGGVIIRGGGENTNPLPYVDIPAAGVSVGYGSVEGQSPLLYLMQDGSYELRVGSEAPLARGADLAAVVRSVVAAPGTPVKVVYRPSDGTSNGSMRFLSTSVGASVTLLLPPAPKPYRHVVPGPPNVFESMPGTFVTMPGQPVETFYTLPTVDEVRAALAAAGTETGVYDRDFLLVKPEGLEVGRSFDDTGLRQIFLTAENGFRLTDAAGAVLWEGDDLLAALGATAPRLGARRLPARLFGRSEVALHGLARGGSAYFGYGGQVTLDPAGGVNTLPDGSALAGRLRQAGVDFTGNGL